ncbi:MAG TPA: hypothetical protein VER14_01620 [Phototrophicaceae bacterium]|nr:hypothetical protein [Phototrophicaceae bacterium]
MPRTNGNGKPHRKTESITLRVEKNIMDELRNEAEQRMESLNTLANQVLKSYVTWHKPAAKAGNYNVPKTLLTDMFEALTEEQIARITENWVRKYSKDVILMINKEHNLESFLDGFRVWMDLSGFQYTHQQDGVFEAYVIRFDMGKKFNYHVGKYLQFLVVEELGAKDVHLEITDFTVMFRFRRE